MPTKIPIFYGPTATPNEPLCRNVCMWEPVKGTTKQRCKTCGRKSFPRDPEPKELAGAPRT